MTICKQHNAENLSDECPWHHLEKGKWTYPLPSPPPSIISQSIFEEFMSNSIQLHVPPKDERGSKPSLAASNDADCRLLPKAA
jgi:hypothetical protein